MIFLASSTMTKNAGDSLGFMEFTVYWRGQYRKIRCTNVATWGSGTKERCTDVRKVIMFFTREVVVSFPEEVAFEMRSGE